MQTFLPAIEFRESAEFLDRARLGKQRVEVKQILNALREGKGGWVNHPATRMWRGYERALAYYGWNICNEWIFRGYTDTLAGEFERGFKIRGDVKRPIPMPPWLGDERLHASHRSNLLRKDPIWYGQWGWDEPDNLPYFWPVSD